MSTRAQAVTVKNIQLERHDGKQRLSAIVDDSEIWFQMDSSYPLERRAEAFLAPAMFEAMVRNASVIIEDEVPVSPKLLHALPNLQSIFRCWNPDLHLVEFNANTGESEAAIDSAICCFSGGVDSSYTFSCHEEEVSHLLVVQGFDTWRSDTDWADNARERGKFANSVDKKIIAVDSNVRAFIEKRNIYWGLVIGSVLGSLGAALAPRLFLIPSSWTYQDLHAYGSHPLVDPLWSTEATSVVHHGADANRSEKIERIANTQSILDQLQVCWKSCSTNCGNCPKCVRTSLVLDLIQARSKNLPPYQSLQQLRVLKPDGEGSLPFVDDLIGACERHGARDIRKKLLLMRKSFLIKDALMTLIKEITGHQGQKLRRLLFPKEWHETRATLRSNKLTF